MKAHQLRAQLADVRRRYAALPDEDYGKWSLARELCGEEAHLSRLLRRVDEVGNSYDYRPGKRVWVTAYAIVRCYGGSEEGGWWYNRYTHIESVRVHRRRHALTARRLFLKHSHLIEGDIGSVLGGTDLSIVPGCWPGEYATRGRPCYE